MPEPIGQTVDTLDTPQLLLDLDVVDANLRYLLDACRRRGVDLRVHFKSLKCAGLARHLAAAGVRGFLCAKLNEAEVLADAGLTDIYVPPGRPGRAWACWSRWTSA
jgi:D-serine deaminase-like pyridoxal phosphate-dependent protein